jgi:hypothetical protein
MEVSLKEVFIRAVTDYLKNRSKESTMERGLGTVCLRGKTWYIQYYQNGGIFPFPATPG